MISFQYVSAAVTASTSASQHDATLPAEAPTFQRIHQATISAASSAYTAVEYLETSVAGTANLAAGKVMLKTNGSTYSNNVVWFGDAVASDSLITILGDEYGTEQQPVAAYTANVR
jgi:hypothetical protein